MFANTKKILTLSSELTMFLKIEKHFWSLKCFHFLFFILTFLFSPFCFNIENIDTKVYLHGFKEPMFSIQEQFTCIYLTVKLFYFISSGKNRPLVSTKIYIYKSLTDICHLNGWKLRFQFRLKVCGLQQRGNGWSRGCCNMSHYSNACLSPVCAGMLVCVLAGIY